MRHGLGSADLFVPTDSDSSDHPMRQLAAVKPVPAEQNVGHGERHHNEGHGRRLTAAFEALEAFPALAESRNHVLRLFEHGQPSTAQLVEPIEGDVALAV